MRVIVCGGRNYADETYVRAVLDDLHAQSPISLLIEGGQRTWDKERMRCLGGADWWGHCWAVSRGIQFRTEKADWNKLGRRAGPIRNQLMIDKYVPDLVVAFPGGSGTADMVQRATKEGIKVHVGAGNSIGDVA